MMKSASQLGREYNLTGQEMNYLLKEQDFLDGEPGDYFPTEKGKLYAQEEYHHRGTGGYDCYNPRWTTRKWDDSIKDVLDLDQETIQHTKEAVAAGRKRQWDDIKAGRAENAGTYLQNLSQSGESSSDENDESSGTNWPAIAAGFMLVAGVGYALYKAVPKVKKWFKNRSIAASKEQAQPQQQMQFKEMPCPACGGRMVLDNDTAIWECEHHDYSISNKELQDDAIFWFCDKCESFLNIQPGFNVKEGVWKCSKCGFINNVIAENIQG